MEEVEAEKIVDNPISLVRIFHLVKSNEEKKLLPMDPYNLTLVFLCKQNLTMSELGERLYRSKPGMTAIVDRLIAEGKVRRLPDQKDRRIIRIEITDDGREFVREKKDETKRSIIKRLANLDDEDFAALCRALEEVNRIFSKIGRN